MHKTHYRTFRKIGVFILIAAISLLSACKSYHLGSPAEIPFKSIYLTPVSNHSYAPQAQAITSSMLRENFIQDARVKVVTKQENADAVLFVDLTDYKRSSAARRQQDTTVADSFDIRLTAEISLLNRETGNYLLTDRSIQVTTNAYTSNPYEDDPVNAYQLSERQTMEQLARDLARKISDEILNPW